MFHVQKKNKDNPYGLSLLCLFGISFFSKFYAIGSITRGQRSLSLGCWYDRYHALVVLSLVEVYSTVNESIESVVLTLSNASTGEVLVTTLANDDVAGCNALTAENLHAKSL